MSEKIVQIINKSSNPLPQYQTKGSAGMDLRAYTQQPIILQPHKTTLIPTGLYIALPPYTEAQIRSRSSLALKGIIVLNQPGTIDQDYRGEIKILLINLSEQNFTIHNGDRIAQMIINTYLQVNWKQVNNLSTTKRGEGGYGSTGIS